MRVGGGGEGDLAREDQALHLRSLWRRGCEPRGRRDTLAWRLVRG
jgi:hypothetical protein